MRQYTHSPGVDQPLSLHTGGATYYYASEAPGQVSGLVNGASQVVNEYRYTPWGELEAISEGVSQPLRYMAREWDDDLGMYQVRARWYDPQLGRFVSEDPIGLAGGINAYAYVGNSPVNATDPSGLCYRGGWGWTVDPGNGRVVSSGACDARDNDISLEALSDYLDQLRRGLGGRIPRGAGGNRPAQPNTCPALLRHPDVLAAGNAAWQRSLSNGQEEGAWLLPTSFGIYLERPVPTGVNYNTLPMGYAPSRSREGLPVALHTHPGGVAAQPAHLRAINWRHAVSTNDTIFARYVNATIVAVSSDSLSMYTPGDSVRTCAR